MKWNIKTAVDLAKQLEERYKNINIPIHEKEVVVNQNELDDEILIGVVFNQDDNGYAKIADVIKYLIKENIKASEEEIKRQFIKLQNDGKLDLLHSENLQEDKKYNINTGTKPKNIVKLK